MPETDQPLSSPRRRDTSRDIKLRGGSHKQHVIAPMWKDHCIHAGATFPPPYHHLRLSLRLRRHRKQTSEKKEKTEKSAPLPLSPESEEFALAYAKAVNRHVEHGGKGNKKSPLAARHFKDNFWKDWTALVYDTCSKAAVEASGIRGSHVDEWDWQALLAEAHGTNREDHHDARGDRDAVNERCKRVEEDGNIMSLNPSQGESSSMKVDKAVTMVGGLGVALVDGVKQPMTSGGMVDRAGIFVGRGEDHPLSGRIRRRIVPSDVEINISADAPVPVPRWKHSSEGRCRGLALEYWGFVGEDSSRAEQRSQRGQWKAVLHEPRVGWLARWNDPLTGTTRYITLDQSAHQKQRHERIKFDMAKRLNTHIKGVRQRMHDDALDTSNPLELQQVALCASIVDAFSIRIGEGKHSDGRTIGATSLRVKNILADVESGMVRLQFRGKDQVCFDSSRPMPSDIIRVLMKHVKRASRQKGGKDARVFWKIEPDGLNRYLDSLLTGMTTKVMRTRAAGNAIEKRFAMLSKEACGKLPRAVLKDLVVSVGMSEVAWLCNHKRDVLEEASGNECRGFQGKSSVQGMQGTEGAVSSKWTEGKDGAKDGSFIVEQEFLREVERAWRTATLVAKDDTLGMACEGCASNRARGIRDLQKIIKNVRLKSRELRLSPETAKVNYIDPRIIVRFSQRCGDNLRPEDVYSNQQLRRFGWAVK